MRSTLDRIPYTNELGITLDSTEGGTVRMTLPGAKSNENLAGTVHAGLLFTFGETLAGVAAGMRTLEKAFPFARGATISYRRPAHGPVFGVASVSEEDSTRVLKELSRDGRSELEVVAELSNGDGEAVAEVKVAYAFRPHPE
jgi:acyl-coenzyme A thioesterase PaaI-like protein